MRHITLNRVAIAFILIYFPMATLGKTGSYWDALQGLMLLISVMVIGAIEQAECLRRKMPPNFKYTDHKIT